jgi:hypothetical protein
MERTDGHPNSAIWLLADSNPVDWQNSLTVPLDRRFPTRHTIWTPIEKVIQCHLFRECKSRLDDKFYIRNAVEDPCHKYEKERLADEIATFRRLLNKHQPLLVLCFGQFAFEFARRARQEKEDRRFSHWTVEMLAEQFNNRISTIRTDAVNVLPLLHVVVAQKFLYCHTRFSGGNGDYFEYVGGNLARVLIEHRTDPRLNGFWM